MKSILVIGISRFAAHLCRNLVAQKNQLMIIDKDETALEELTPLVSSALIADCTRRDVLENVGVPDFDICFVCISDDFQAFLKNWGLITLSAFQDVTYIQSFCSVTARTRLSIPIRK